MRHFADGTNEKAGSNITASFSPLDKRRLLIFLALMFATLIELSSQNIIYSKKCTSNYFNIPHLIDLNQLEHVHFLRGLKYVKQN